MGPSGALIVLERSRSSAKVESVEGDFWVVVQDWMHNTSVSIYEGLRYNMMGYVWSTHGSFFLIIVPLLFDPFDESLPLFNGELQYLQNVAQVRYVFT